LRKKKSFNPSRSISTSDVVIAQVYASLQPAEQKEGKTSHENGPREENDVRDDVYLLTKPFTIAFYWLFVMVQRQIFTNNNVEAEEESLIVPLRSGLAWSLAEVFMLSGGSPQCIVRVALRNTLSCPCRK
jgi:hypothetical protein